MSSRREPGGKPALGPPAHVVMEYRDQLASGKLDGPIRTGWDLKRNVAI